MEKNQASQGAHACALSTRNRLLCVARLSLLALFLALSVVGLQPKNSAQAAGPPARHAKASAPDCPECDEAYIQCLSGGGGAQCQIRYEDCLAHCQNPAARSR